MVLPQGRCALDVRCCFGVFFWLETLAKYLSSEPRLGDLSAVCLPSHPRGGRCLSQQALAHGPAHFCLKSPLKTSSCWQSSSSYLKSVIQHSLLPAVTPWAGHQSHQWSAVKPCPVLILSIIFCSVFHVLNLLVKLPIPINTNACEEPGSLPRFGGNAIGTGGEGQLPLCVRLCKVSWWPWEKEEEKDANAASFSSSTERINKKHGGLKNQRGEGSWDEKVRDSFWFFNWINGTPGCCSHMLQTKCSTLLTLFPQNTRKPLNETTLILHHHLLWLNMRADTSSVLEASTSARSTCRWAHVSLAHW